MNEQLKVDHHLGPDDARKQLSQQQGVRYELDDQRTEQLKATATEQAHTLYVIRKLHRDKDGVEKTLRFYYILDGFIYEAPTLASVVRTRLLRLGWYLREAFDVSRRVADPLAANDEGAAEANAIGSRKRPRQQ